MDGIARAALAHLWFGVIHPFEDGNSRVGRAIVDMARLDVTRWVKWFVQAFTASCVTAQSAVQQAVDKAAFRLRASGLAISERQTRVLMRLLEASDGGFRGGMTADKYCKITGASKATATRDLQDLLGKGLLMVQGQGKATRYALTIAGRNRQRVV